MRVLVLAARLHCVAALSVSFTPPHAESVAPPDSDATWALGRMQRASVAVPGVGTVDTTFYRAGAGTVSGERYSNPTVLLLHGGDSTCLEWRFVARRLAETGRDVCAVDWWSGGWTSRAEITAAITAGKKPWDCIREHVRAFWQQELGGAPVQLVGTSMGGAVALDFAATHPDAVSKLTLVDAGGESYAAPPPDVGSFLAPFCPVILRAQAFLQPKFGDAAALGNLHRASPGWVDAYVAYLASGGYELRVGPDLIRTVPQPTRVIWGDNDPVLDPGDAEKFRIDLPNCEGVTMIPGGGHSPQLLKVDDVVAELSSWLD